MTERPRAIPAGQVQSLSRALGVLRAIAAAEDGLILRDVARRTGLAVSTAHRLLTTLEAERFVRADPETGRWTIGPDAFLVGASFLQSRDLLALARPRLRHLAQRWSETASLYVEAEGRLICVAQSESRQMMRAVARVGGEVDLHSSAAGKSVLALRPPEEAAAYAAAGLTRRTPRTLSTPAALMEDLEGVRARGWARDDEELVEGVRCVAAAILDHDGRAIGALSLSGPKARMTAETLEAISGSVMAVAADLSREMGAGGRAAALTIPAPRPGSARRDSR